MLYILIANSKNRVEIKVRQPKITIKFLIREITNGSSVIIGSHINDRNRGAKEVLNLFCKNKK
jgi:hypothetical protein